jgi:hypothetical protein
MERKRRAPNYNGALAERIYLDRNETVDQVMARTVRKIPPLFKHHKIDPSDAQSWQKLAVRLALAHVPGLQVSMRGGGRKRTWKAGQGEKAGQGDKLVRAFEDEQSRTGKGTKDVLVKLLEDKFGPWKGLTLANLGSRLQDLALEPPSR